MRGKAILRAVARAWYLLTINWWHMHDCGCLASIRTGFAASSCNRQSLFWHSAGATLRALTWTADRMRMRMRMRSSCGAQDRRRDV